MAGDQSRGTGGLCSAARPDIFGLLSPAEGLAAPHGSQLSRFHPQMSLLVATADGTEVQVDSRPGTATLLPASASTWMRTLRSSREGSLATLRASHAAARAAARAGGSQVGVGCSPRWGWGWA